MGMFPGARRKRQQVAATAPAVVAKFQCVLSIVLRSVKCGGCGGELQPR